MRCIEVADPGPAKEPTIMWTGEFPDDPIVEVFALCLAARISEHDTQSRGLPRYWEIGEPRSESREKFDQIQDGFGDIDSYAIGELIEQQGLGTSSQAAVGALGWDPSEGTFALMLVEHRVLKAKPCSETQITAGGPEADESQAVLGAVVVHDGTAVQGSWAAGEDRIVLRLLTADDPWGG